MISLARLRDKKKKKDGEAEGSEEKADESNSNVSDAIWGGGVHCFRGPHPMCMHACARVCSGYVGNL